MTGRSARPLVVLAHGTADEAGQRTITRITQDAAAHLGLPPRLGYVDVCGPTAAEALAGVESPVVVPLFLTSGYHVRTDIPEATRAASGATVTDAVGSGAAVVAALVDRVGAAEPDPDVVVLAGAGSSDADARAEVAAAARLLDGALGVPVRHAFLSAAGPTVAEASAGVSGKVVVASHLLAPGHFQGVLERTAAEIGAVATRPIGAHPQVAARLVELYRGA